MRRIVPALMLIGLLAAPAAAQGRRDSQGIPPGQLPAPGECRVWYDGRPPGQQPRATSCREAERIAAGDRRARVIYGAARDDRFGRNDRRGPVIVDPGRPRAIPRTTPRQIPSGAPYPNGRGVYGDLAFDNGYQDGYDKGREDARDNDRYDPARHGRFRSADHGFDRRYGSKVEYQRVYRDGFRTGYDEGYRDNDRRARNNRRWPEIRLPWPF